MNIVRTVKSVKKPEDVKYSGDNYFMKLIMDVLLLIILIIRLHDGFKFR